MAEFTKTALNRPELIAGDFPLVTREVDLTDISASGALTEGALLGKVTANGKYGLSLTGSADGSEVPRAILAIDADPSGGDVKAMIFETGIFDETLVVYGAAHTADSVREGLRDLSIFLRKPVAV